MHGFVAVTDPGWYERLVKLVALLISVAACGSAPAPSDGGGRADAGAMPMDAGQRDAGRDGGSDAGPVCEPRIDTLVAPDFFFLTDVDPIGADHLLFGSRGSTVDGVSRGRPRVLRRRDGGTIVWAVAVASAEIDAADGEPAFGSRGAAASDGSFRVAFATPEALTVLRGSGEPAVDWSVRLAAPPGERLDPRVAIAVAPDGGVIAAASLGEDLLVVALDEHGNALWQRRLAAPRTERVTGLAVLESGEIIVLGWSDSFTDAVYEGPFGPRSRELAWIVTMARDGAVRSQRAIRPTGELGAKVFLVRPELTHVAAVGGSLRIGGSAWTEGGMWGFSRHIWLIAADATGMPTASRLLHDPGGRFSTVVGLASQGADRVLVVGETSSGASLTTLSATGTVVRHVALRVGSAMGGAVGERYLFAAIARLCTYDDLGRPEDCVTTQRSTIIVDLGGTVVLPPCLAPLRDDSVAPPAIEPFGVVAIDTDAVVSPADLAVSPGSETLVPDDVEVGTFCYDRACS